MSAFPPKEDIEMLDHSDDFIGHSRAMFTAALREKLRSDYEILNMHQSLAELG
jgi:hypothetical protein